MATTNDLKNGMTLNLDGQLWTVVEFQHVKPGKGPAFVRTKMKHGLGFILAEIPRGEPRNAARGSAPSWPSRIIQPIAWRFAAE